MEQKHLSELKGPRKELVEKDGHHAAKTEKTNQLLKEAEWAVQSAHQDLEARQAKDKIWQSKLGAIN